MVEKGLFEKRIRAIFKRRFPEMKSFPKEIEDMAVSQFLPIIAEAKKEFVWRYIVDDLIEGKGYWSEYDIKVVAKWFRKWFGDDET